MWGLSAVVGFPNIMGLNHKFTAHLEWFILVHYWSKFLDLFDTIFIVLRRKDRQLSFLHIYHHATILPQWGILLAWGIGNGTAAFGALCNSIIHVIMYSHYLIRSFNIENPFKRYITQCQLFQFGLLIIHAVLVVCVEQVLPAPAAWMQVAYQTSMMILFTDFYRKQYKAKKSRKKAA